MCQLVPSVPCKEPHLTWSLKHTPAKLEKLIHMDCSFDRNCSRNMTFCTGFAIGRPLLTRVRGNFRDSSPFKLIFHFLAFSHCGRIDAWGFAWTFSFYYTPLRLVLRNGVYLRCNVGSQNVMPLLIRTTPLERGTMGAQFFACWTSSVGIAKSWVKKEAKKVLNVVY